MMLLVSSTSTNPEPQQKPESQPQENLESKLQPQPTTTEIANCRMADG